MRALAAALAIPILVGSALADTSEGTLVRITVVEEMSAPPAAVWTALTTGASLVTWCPVWKAPANAEVKLTRVGDTLEFLDEWGNGGRSIVTFLEPNRELRVAHEPTTGEYLCQVRVQLEAKGSGSTVTYMEQYSDDSSDEDRIATAGKTEAAMKSTLAALEGHVAGG
jgi:uncharacterized protein YndB with AHSA1/START domain